jgi:hypothetical protein
MVALAQNLAVPGLGDLELTCHDGMGQVKLLHAITPILTERSEYYAQSLSATSAILMSISVFAFDQNIRLTQEAGLNDDNAKSHDFGGPRKKITDEDYDLLHNILYYLYTDNITFGTRVHTILPSNLPKLCSVEDIYMAADRMLLGELKDRALQFLKLSCTADNITSRLMSTFAELHDEVGTVYEAYFRENWDRIKNKEEFEQLFMDLKDTESKESWRMHAKFREMMKGAVFLDSIHPVGALHAEESFPRPIQPNPAYIQ